MPGCRNVSSALVAGLVLLRLCVSSSIADAVDDHRRATLKGLTGVNVAVEILDPEIERAGLMREQLQTAAELKLRQSAIHVLTDEERFKIPGKPFLYVNLQTYQQKENKNLVFFHFQVQLKQDVLLARDNTPSVATVTWETPQRLGVVGISKVRDLRAVIIDDVERFCNEYLTVNPNPEK